MRLAVFLIALGFGYKIFSEGTQSQKKSLKRLGRTIGASIMILSGLASVLLLGAAAKCLKTGCAVIYCPFDDSGKSRGMMKKWCPFTGKELPPEPAQIKNE